jgi:hypothetical protein
MQSLELATGITRTSNPLLFSTNFVRSYDKADPERLSHIHMARRQQTRRSQIGIGQKKAEQYMHSLRNFLQYLSGLGQ